MFCLKRYIFEFGGSMLLYTVVLFLSIGYLNYNPESPWKLWISISPVLPAMLSVVAIARAVRRLDEMLQKIQLMSFAISFAIVALVTFTYGFLENIGYPHISYIYVLPFMTTVWGIVNWIVFLIYR